jgi:hypothetical protein
MYLTFRKSNFSRKLDSCEVLFFLTLGTISVLVISFIFAKIEGFTQQQRVFAAHTT